MEQLFSTVAQITFTIVGLFFVALTVEPESRDFWFSNKINSRFVAINLIFMLLPGFLALGGLLPPLYSLHSWPIMNISWSFAYWIILRRLFQMKKLGELHHLKALEEEMDFLTSCRLTIGFLILVTILGIYSYFAPSLATFTDFLFSIFLFASIVASISPVSAFLRAYLANKPYVSPANRPTTDFQSEHSEFSKKFGKSEAQSSFDVFLVLLFSAVAFLVGLLIRKD
jgi:hypothetical protein